MEKICIGTIVNTHGIKGEVRIRSFSDFDEIRYKKGSSVYVGDEEVPLTVRSFRRHKGFSLVAFEGMNSINDVEKYKTRSVYIDASARDPLPEGEFYYSDLEGLSVFDEDNHLIGRCAAVEPTVGAQNNLRIELTEGRQVLIPFVPAFVREVSREKKKMIIHLMEGLI